MLCKYKACLSGFVPRILHFVARCLFLSLEKISICICNLAEV